MKLKTKFQDEDFDLGEGADVDITTMPDGCFKASAKAMRGGLHTFYYDTKADFDNDWEDALEEPKDFWFIDPEVLIACESTNPLLCDKKVAIETMKQIGNYFETREETEKAVEKLKAFKRLKDKGFEFIGKTYETGKRFGSIFYKVDDDTYSEDIIDDLNLLFGGEE